MYPSFKPTGGAHKAGDNFWDVRFVATRGHDISGGDLKSTKCVEDFDKVRFAACPKNLGGVPEVVDLVFLSYIFWNGDHAASFAII